MLVWVKFYFARSARRHRIGKAHVEVVDVEDIDALGFHGLDGAPITEVSLEAAADRAERRQRAGLIPGGKSLSGDGAHSPALRVVVSQETAALVRRRAAAQEMSVSRWLRGLIEREVA
jgi:hypothetical protein